MYTITDIAKKLNVKRDIAYGLIHFMQAKGYLEVSSTLHLPHQKGKPAALYNITDDVLAGMAGELSDVLCAAQETTVEAPAAAQVAPTTEAAQEATQSTSADVEVDVSQLAAENAESAVDTVAV